MQIGTLESNDVKVFLQSKEFYDDINANQCVMQNEKEEKTFNRIIEFFLVRLINQKFLANFAFVDILNS